MYVATFRVEFYQKSISGNNFKQLMHTDLISVDGFGTKALCTWHDDILGVW